MFSLTPRTLASVGWESAPGLTVLCPGLLSKDQMRSTTSVRKLVRSFSARATQPKKSTKKETSPLQERSVSRKEILGTFVREKGFSRAASRLSDECSICRAPVNPCFDQFRLCLPALNSVFSRTGLSRRRLSASVTLAIWLIAVLFIISPPASSQDILPELVRRIKPSAVAIETYDARGEKLSRGSGFFIDTDRIVTNRHVIEGAIKAEVHSSTGNVYPVKGVLAVDAEGDIALLKIEAPPNQIRPLALERTSPQEGESVLVIGNPFGLEGSVTNGIVSAVRDIPTFGRIIQITAPISPGSSGSPVVNMRGQVIGVATLQITGGQSVNFAIPSERVSQLQTGTLTSLVDLAASTGRTKRAQAVQFFRDGLSFLSKY